MSREEIIKSMSLQDAIQVFKDTNCYGTMDIAKSVILKALEQEPCEAEIQKMQDFEFAEIQKAYEIGKAENIDVLDKIRAEIKQMPTISFNANDIYKADVLAILDKYRAEREE